MSDFQQQQAEEERYRMECEAIDRCAKAGADIEDLKVICRGMGIDIKHTVLGDEIRITERRAA
jgi:hypothetical protein